MKRSALLLLATAIAVLSCQMDGPMSLDDLSERFSVRMTSAELRTSSMSARAVGSQAIDSMYFSHPWIAGYQAPEDPDGWWTAYTISGSISTIVAGYKLTHAAPLYFNEDMLGSVFRLPTDEWIEPATLRFDMISVSLENPGVEIGTDLYGWTWGSFDDLYGTDYTHHGLNPTLDTSFPNEYSISVVFARDDWFPEVKVIHIRDGVATLDEATITASSATGALTASQISIIRQGLIETYYNEPSGLYETPTSGSVIIIPMSEVYEVRMSDPEAPASSADSLLADGLDVNVVVDFDYLLEQTVLDELVETGSSSNNYLVFGTDLTSPMGMDIQFEPLTVATDE